MFNLNFTICLFISVNLTGDSTGGTRLYKGALNDGGGGCNHQGRVNGRMDERSELPADQANRGDLVLVTLTPGTLAQGGDFRQHPGRQGNVVGLRSRYPLGQGGPGRPGLPHRGTVLFFQPGAGKGRLRCKI